MSKTGPKLYLAIDGGTTNTRARLFRGDVFLSVASRPVGVRNVAVSGSTIELRQAVAECIAEASSRANVRIVDLDVLCASGMLTSNVGLREVPHVLAPAGLDDLARHVVAAPFPDIAPQSIHLIPGVKTIPSPATLENLATLDILRGEESETFGILETTKRTGPICVLLPGSHTKLLHVDDHSRITASYTTIGGELMQSLAERTILASSIDWPPGDPPDWPAVEAGARFAREWGLARGAFAVRLSDVLVGSDRAERTWWFVGLVAGSDSIELLRWRVAHPLECGDLSPLSSSTDAEDRSGDKSPHSKAGIPLLVGGREPLRSVYGRLAASAWSGPVEILDESVVELASARGAIAIASVAAR
jgi:2-dehydro-3-deoxygalactonokinase